MKGFVFSFCLFIILGGASCCSTEVVVDKKEPSPYEYIYVLGDLQSYTSSINYLNYYVQTIKWISNQLSLESPIKAVLQVGDITNNNYPHQWRFFYESTVKLTEKVPFFVCTGNHDYDWANINDTLKIKDRGSTLINEYAGFASTRGCIIDYFSGNSLENYVAKFSVFGEEFYLLVLEFGARKEVLDWASNIVQNNSKTKFILLTHEWLTRNGERISSDSFAELQFSGFDSYSTPEQIWQYLVRRNNNILCVLCGHSGFAAKLFSQNDAGRQVPQILFNLQYQDNGGNGLLQIWEFAKDSGVLNICAFDTINCKWYLPDSTSVRFNYMI